MGIEALLLSQVITITGSTGQVVTKQADGSLALEDAAGGGIAGSTGATDNAVLRADGAGGATLQNSGVTISDNSEVLIVSGAAGAKPLCVKGAASQTGNLQEWQDSSGTATTCVASDGGLKNTSAGGVPIDGQVFGGSNASASFRQNGVAYVVIGSFGTVMSSTRQYKWGTASSNPTNASVDTGIARDSAGVVKITNGSTGTGQLIFIVPTTDPGIAGALWNNGGTLAISAG